MILLGIIGKKESGKDTVYSIIKEAIHPKTCIRIGFADSLKEEIAVAINAVNAFYGRPQSDKIDKNYIDEHKNSFRLILQGWGTDFRRNLVSKDYWINRVLQKLASLSNDYYIVVVSDVRFKNEATMIESAGGYLIKINRHNVPVYLDAHPSEREMDSIENIDQIIENNDTIDSLKIKTKLTLSILLNGSKHKI